VFVCHFEGLTQALRVVQTPARFAAASDDILQILPNLGLAPGPKTV
jgi:hypothetical protein